MNAMGSRKQQALAKQRAQAKAKTSDAMDDLFAREERLLEQGSVGRERALRRKTCASKNRYASQAEADAAADECEERGAPRLNVYQCPYCNGWHLTSKPER